MATQKDTVELNANINQMMRELRAKLDKKQSASKSNISPAQPSAPRLTLSPEEEKKTLKELHNILTELHLSEKSFISNMLKMEKTIEEALEKNQEKSSGDPDRLNEEEIRLLQTTLQHYNTIAADNNIFANAFKSFYRHVFVLTQDRSLYSLDQDELGIRVKNKCATILWSDNTGKIQQKTLSEQDSKDIIELLKTTYIESDYAEFIKAISSKCHDSKAFNQSPGYNRVLFYSSRPEMKKGFIEKNELIVTMENSCFTISWSDNEGNVISKSLTKQDSDNLMPHLKNADMRSSNSALIKTIISKQVCPQSPQFIEKNIPIETKKILNTFDSFKELLHSEAQRTGLIIRLKSFGGICIHSKKLLSIFTQKLCSGDGNKIMEIGNYLNLPLRRLMQYGMLIKQLPDLFEKLNKPNESNAADSLSTRFQLITIKTNKLCELYENLEKQEAEREKGILEALEAFVNSFTEEEEEVYTRVLRLPPESLKPDKIENNDLLAQVKDDKLIIYRSQNGKVIAKELDATLCKDILGLLENKQQSEDPVLIQIITTRCGINKKNVEENSVGTKDDILTLEYSKILTRPVGQLLGMLPPEKDTFLYSVSLKENTTTPSPIPASNDDKSKNLSAKSPERIAIGSAAVLAEFRRKVEAAASGAPKTTSSASLNISTSSAAIPQSSTSSTTTSVSSSSRPLPTPRALPTPPKQAAANLTSSSSSASTTTATTTPPQPRVLPTTPKTNPPLPPAAAATPLSTSSTSSTASSSIAERRANLEKGMILKTPEAKQTTESAKNVPAPETSESSNGSLLSSAFSFFGLSNSSSSSEEESKPQAQQTLPAAAAASSSKSGRFGVPVMPTVVGKWTTVFATALLAKYSDLVKQNDNGSKILPSVTFKLDNMAIKVEIIINDTKMPLEFKTYAELKDFISKNNIREMDDDQRIKDLYQELARKHGITINDTFFQADAPESSQNNEDSSKEEGIFSKAASSIFGFKS